MADFLLMDRLSCPKTLSQILTAEAKLATLPLAEDLAVLWETESQPALQRHFADAYRKVMGIHPSQRITFAEGLERIHKTGEGTVGELITSLNRTNQLLVLGQPEPGHPRADR